MTKLENVVMKGGAVVLAAVLLYPFLGHLSVLITVGLVIAALWAVAVSLAFLIGQANRFRGWLQKKRGQDVDDPGD